MEITDQQIEAIREALEAAYIALTTGVSANQQDVASALVRFRLAQLNRNFPQKRAATFTAVSI